MGPKRRFLRATAFRKRRTRTSIALELKLEIIKQFEEGKRCTDIGKAFGLSESTVRTIRLNSAKYKLKGYAEKLALQGTSLDVTRDGIMKEMEKYLRLWIDNEEMCNRSPTTAIIQQKAKEIFDDLNCQMVEGSSPIENPFYASKQWFEQFKASYGLHNAKMKCEVGSADEAASMTIYPSTLREIIEEDGYSPKQVFNVCETGLFWKKMPTSTFITDGTGTSEEKDRLTLLLGGNASGDFKLKPLLVYHSENPRALQGFAKARLPVIWRSNKKASVTQSVFTDWFCTFFCPAVSKYLSENNLPDKALLILDNAPSHATNLDDLSDGKVKVVYLPSSSCLQPMDQNIISIFKCYYLKRTLTQCIEETEGEFAPNLEVIWEAFNISKAINNIQASWDDVSSKTMNAAWRNVWPDCVTHFHGADETPEQIQEQIVDLGRQLGFEDLQVEDVQELLHNEDLSAEDLQELDEHRVSEDDDDEIPSKILSTSTLSEFFRHWDVMKNILDESDPDRERSSKVIREVENSLRCYKEIFGDKKRAAAKQIRIDNVFTLKEESGDQPSFQ